MFALSRTWVKKDGRSPSFFLFPVTRCRPVVKALERGRVQPMYAKARTWGTRPGGKAGEEARDLSHNQRFIRAAPACRRAEV
jgi:hypothetical protein